MRSHLIESLQVQMYVLFLLVPHCHEKYACFSFLNHLSAQCRDHPRAFREGGFVMISGFQGEDLVQIFDFPIHSIRVATHSGKQGKQGKWWKKKFPAGKNQGI